MRVAIYNRWLHTMGGGERETAAFAAALASEHDVDLLTHAAVDPRAVAERLDLRLPEGRLRTLPFDPDYAHVIAASTEYDLFLNISHGDLFVPRARRNLLRVFFPEPAHDEEGNTDGSGPRLHSGFYAPEAGGDRVFAWTGAKAVMSLTRAEEDGGGAAWLRLTLHGWRPGGARAAIVRLVVEGLPMASRVLPRDGGWLGWDVALPAVLARRETLEVTLETTTFEPRAFGADDDGRELGVALAAAWLAERRDSVEPPGARPDDRRYRRMRARKRRWSARGYDRTLANSEYTRRWIERRWGLASDVLYPPVEVEKLRPAAKRRSILSVGRFFAGSHNKKHAAMIAAFRELCDAGLSGWEYHLVGGCDEAQPEHRRYLDEVRAAAAGYPIRLHVNRPFGELQALYGEAELFWHATGFGEDAERHPERFEHFGISTVEAQAAACTPLVFAGGGQPEIVEDGVSGFLWRTPEELQARTRALVENPTERRRIGARAHELSRNFDTQRFERRLQALLGELEALLGAGIGGGVSIS